MESVGLCDIVAVIAAMANLSVLFLAALSRLESEGRHFQRIRHIK